MLNRKIDWDRMVSNITSYVMSLNFKYRANLMDSDVESARPLCFTPSYINAKGSFVDANTVHIKSAQTERDLTARHIVIATGGRPSIPFVSPLSLTRRSIPGAKELAITSDDLFRLSKPPGGGGARA